MPSPEQVHELLTAKFGTTRSYEHQLVRYLLAYRFSFGIRAPSEFLSARISDVDLEHGIIIVQETKKGGTRRELVVKPAMQIPDAAQPRKLDQGAMKHVRAADRRALS